MLRFMVEATLGTAIAFVIFGMPLWHWTRQSADFFERTGTSHRRWKSRWTIALFTGTLPFLGLYWWYVVLQDHRRKSTRPPGQPVGV